MTTPQATAYALLTCRSFGLRTLPLLMGLFALACPLGRWSCLRGRLWILRHHLRAHLGVGCENAMEANQVQSGAWHGHL